MKIAFATSLRSFLPLGKWTNWLCLVVLLGSVGCNQQPAIRQYTVPKESSSALATGGSAAPREILAAIVPKSQDAWFFKMMGEPEKVDQYKQEFRQLVNSLSFSEDGKPKWQLPEKWREEEGSQFIYASLRPPGEEALKVTVSQLPMPGDPAQLNEDAWRDYVVLNVNRWRGQLQLSDQAWDEMVSDLEPVENLSTEKAPAYFVSLRGSGEAGGGMAGMSAPPSGTMPGVGALPGGKPTAPSDIQYTLPEGWREVAPLSVIAMKSFEIDGPEGTKASATFTSASGDRVSNVARWNSQVGGSEEQLAKALESSEKLTVNGVPAEVVFLVGPEPEKQAITAAIVEWNSQNSLFVKLFGPAAAVEPQRDAFLALVKSLKW